VILSLGEELIVNLWFFIISILLLTRQTARAWPIVNPRTNTILVRVVLIVGHKCMHLTILFNSSMTRLFVHASFMSQHSHRNACCQQQHIRCLISAHNQARTTFSGSNSRTHLATCPPIYTLPHEFCKPWAKHLNHIWFAGHCLIHILCLL
jgi:hypothetical protein